MKFEICKVSVFVALLACISCVSPSTSAEEEIMDGMTKTYYVKGMTCGGCILHVSTALDRNMKTIAYAQKKIGVGTLKLTFKRENYKDQETDCAIISAIESSTEYKVFYDEQFKSPACQKPPRG